AARARVRSTGHTRSREERRRDRARVNVSARDRFGLVGKVVADKYAINRVLGEGGYGVVYEARNLVLDMQIAIKVLKPAWGSVEEQQKGIASFQREARILATLSHPAIVRFYDVGVLSDGGLPYSVFELLSGKTIAD